MTSSDASTLETIVVESGGTLTVPSDLNLSVTSFETQTGGVTNSSSNITASTLTFAGGRVNAPSSTIKSTGDTTVSASTSFSGTLEVDGHLDVSSTLSAYNGNGVGNNLVVEANTLTVGAAGKISSAGAISNNGDDMTITVTGALVNNGQINSNGSSSGGSAGNVTVTSNHISGSGSFNLSGYRGANGSG